MSQKQVLALNSETEIPCLLLPLVDTTLLVPTVTIAEIAPMKPLEEIPDTPDWLIGYYKWREIKVPVLQYEVLCGSAHSQLNMEGRIAVLNNTGTNESLPFIAVPTQGIPRMARVSANDISEDEIAKKKPFHKMVVKLGMEDFVIPDVTALEKAYLHLV